MVNMMPHPKKANCSQRSGSFWRTAEQPQMQVQASIRGKEEETTVQITGGGAGQAHGHGAAADEDGAMHERVTASGAAFRHYGVTEESETDATA